MKSKDNKQLRDSRDRSKVDSNDASEVEYLHSKYPDRNHNEIKAAIKKYGPVRAKIEAAFQKKNL